MKKILTTFAALSLAVMMCGFPAFAADSRDAEPYGGDGMPPVAEPSIPPYPGMAASGPQATPTPTVIMIGTDRPDDMPIAPSTGKPVDMPIAPPHVPGDMPIVPPLSTSDQDPIAPVPEFTDPPIAPVPTGAPITPAPAASVYVTREMQLMGLVAMPDSDGTTVTTLVDMAAQDVHDHAAAFPEPGCIFRVLQEASVANPDTVVATGMELAQWDGDHEMGTYEIIVMGDVVGTGKMSITQLTRMAQAVTGTCELTGAFLTAGDWNGDGSITVTDLVKESELLRGEVPELPVPRVV